MNVIFWVFFYFTLIPSYNAHRAADALGRCPACRMKNIEGWYIELNHGQRIGTCAMNDGKKASKGETYFSHPTNLGALMGTYIVDESKCDSACPKCRDAESPLLDPLTGKRITSGEYYVCLQYGEKIYFATKSSKEKYVKITKDFPYFRVNSLVCGGEECVDAWMAPEKSPPSKADGSKEKSSKDESKPTENGFCTGKNAMFNGFQVSINSTCVLLLFQDWVLDTELKYVLGVIGVFLSPVLNAFLVRLRVHGRKYVSTSLKNTKNSSNYRLLKYSYKTALALLFVAQMTIAYWLMLFVMTYETIVFLALVLGFGFSFVLLENLDEDIEDAVPLTNGKNHVDEEFYESIKDSKSFLIHIHGMKCMPNCGSTVVRALEKLDGVENVYMHFPLRQAVILGRTTMEKIIDTVEMVGFEAKALDRPSYDVV